jgi:Flp pilus assembly protein TadG
VAGMLTRLRRLRRRFAADERGVSAVEFALILPFLAYLYFGAVELLEGVAISRQVALTATTVGTVVSQYTTISASSQMPDILNASVQIMQPYTTGNATVIVSAISIDSTGKATVAWSQALNGTARSTGQVMTLPSALDTPNSTVLFSEASYAYTPTFDFIHMGTKTLYSSVYMLPRDSTTINLAS